VALRFCLDNPHIATVVPGIKSVAEVEEIAACSDLTPLDSGDMAKVQQMYRQNFKEG
jgi:aryl-alcohol dehydrogenase-like predicted oxidoreductase